MSATMRILAALLALWSAPVCYAQEMNVLRCIDRLLLPDFGPGLSNMYSDEMTVRVSFDVTANGLSSGIETKGRASRSVEKIVRGYIERGRFRRTCSGKHLTLSFVFRPGAVTGARRDEFVTWKFLAPDTIEMRYSLH
jgi:hypothetical protein